MYSESLLKIYILFLFILFFGHINSQIKHTQNPYFNSFDKKVMTGYQGWFTTNGDSAKIGWNNYANNWVFNEKVCRFDLWPETKEYKKLYKTPITDAQGNPTFLFSSNDESTIDLHMKWMQEYEIDGAFVQRFFLALWDATRSHYIKVLKNIMKSGKKYNRSISVMYDISGLQTEKDADVVINDWKFLVDSLKITSSNEGSYLFHQKRPIVGIIIVGLKDSPANLKYIEKIIKFLKFDKTYGNCSVVLGVPFYWRTLNRDSTSDPYLFQLIKNSDYIMPWSVGRINYNNLTEVSLTLEEDMKWCIKNNKHYLPVIYPGFSWHNTVPSAPLDEIPRNNGMLYKKQIEIVKNIKTNIVFAAMFDEINEGTAIFKLSKKPPNTSKMKFVSYEKEESEDYYLKLLHSLSIFLKK